MCMNFFIVCIPKIVYLHYVHFVSVDRRLLSRPSTYFQTYMYLIGLSR